MRVSIIIPTYNRAHYLDAALRSVVQQDYPALEIIVIDDGSTDDTRQVIEAYAGDGRVTYVYQNNSGKPSIARNHGLSRVTGELVCFLDSDDLLLPGSVSKRVAAFNEHESLAVLCTSSAYLRENEAVDFNRNTVPRDRQWIASLPPECIINSQGTLTLFSPALALELFNSDFVFTSSVMVRREVIAQSGFFDEELRIGEDYDLWMRIVCRHGMGFIEEPLAVRRRHADNITLDQRANMAQDELVLRKFLTLQDRPAPKNSQRERDKIVDFFTECAFYCYFQDDFPLARQYFRKAFDWKITRSALIYYFVSCLPVAVVGALRALRGRDRGVKP